MATIQLSLNGKIIEDFPLTKENTTIGRKSDNDIILDNLAVSSHHAKISSILNDFFVEDTGSTNGTFLNNTLIKKQALNHGDAIKIGKHELRYLAENSDGSNGFDKTTIINPSAEGMPENEGNQDIDRSVNQLAQEIASTDSGNELSTGNAKIRLLNGANSGKELPLTKTLTTLGKPGLQVAAITRRPTGYFLIHVDGSESAGRPKVNNAEIDQQAHALSNNDEIEVAGVKMTFFID